MLPTEITVVYSYRTPTTVYRVCEQDQTYAPPRFFIASRPRTLIAAVMSLFGIGWVQSLEHYFTRSHAMDKIRELAAREPKS